MDAQNHINTYDESPLGNMFENLVDMSNPIDPYKGWKPMLAVSWKRVNDTTFQFQLRENVKFHNGEPFDAEAVKFSIDRLLGRVDKSFLPPTVAWHAYDTINKAEPVDRYTVNVITKVPDPIVLNRFNGFGMRMVSPKFYSEHPTAYLQNNANGTGPYRFVSWVKDGDLVMEANQQYWGGAPAFEKVIIRTVPEASTRVSALMSGQADVTVAVPAEQGDMVNRSGRARVEHVTQQPLRMVADERQRGAHQQREGAPGGQLRREHRGAAPHRVQRAGRADLDRHRQVPLRLRPGDPLLPPRPGQGQEAPEGIRACRCPSRSTSTSSRAGTPRTRTWARGSSGSSTRSGPSTSG